MTALIVCESTAGETEIERAAMPVGMAVGALS